MATRSVAAVFGGSGFIGRYVVKRLAAQGYVVRVCGRNTESAKALMTAGRVGQVVPLYVSLTNPATIERAIEGANVAVNLVGILAERHPGDFQRIQADGAGRIARAAAAAGVARMVQVSAIGADPDGPSAYAKTKAGGEAQVRAAMPGAVVLRPSVVFGAEDQFFNRFGQIAMLSPVMPVIHGETRFQPVYVGDVADAVAAALTREDALGALYELGGPRIYTFRELLDYVLRETRRRRRLLTVPLSLARLQARISEWIPGKPLTRDQLLLLARDNVVSPGVPGLEALGITPTPLELVVPPYLDRYRPGGGKRDDAPAIGDVDRPGADLSMRTSK
ncbi:MAG: complex I NDUFA9 subunit family protein [Acetobacteraceae bacterium]|nr:complex I NDUFA9 subunit family protein [Acetobacteraceae bacterium]